MSVLSELERVARDRQARVSIVDATGQDLSSVQCATAFEVIGLGHYVYNLLLCPLCHERHKGKSPLPPRAAHPHCIKKPVISDPATQPNNLSRNPIPHPPPLSHPHPSPRPPSPPSLPPLHPLRQRLNQRNNHPPPPHQIPLLRTPGHM